MSRFREFARRIWSHMDGPLGILLVLIAVFSLGGAVKSWQDRDEITRVDARVHSVQAGMAQLCTDRVADLTGAYNGRQEAVDRLLHEQTDRITEQSARISEQSARIDELTRATSEIGQRQNQVLRNTANAASTSRDVAREVAKQTAKETVKQSNDEARNAINRAITKKPPP